MGCEVCHLGDPLAEDKDAAHQGVVVAAGDLSVAGSTCGRCHAELVARLRTSPMNEGRGMVAVNRFAFGEQDTPDGTATLAGLGESPADQHLRQLCVACHLGASRSGEGTLQTGGGCSACHLAVDPGGGHGQLTLDIDSQACFGCHSGSSRISLSYEGWHETTTTEQEAKAQAGLRVLDDGRVLSPMPADLHFEAGLECIDCHTAREVMGDGHSHAHEEDATEIRCADCHRRERGETVGFAELDDESQTLLRLRGRAPDPGAAFVLSSRGKPLVNVTVDSLGRVSVQEKATGQVHRASPPAAPCLDSEHGRLSCQLCHSSWAPQCIGCHTHREQDGTFREYEGEFLAEPPMIGERGGQLVAVVPGMVMQLDDGGGKRLVRLFAPIAPHTTRRQPRSCESCHQSPAALGFGRGRLSRDPGGRWVLEAHFETLSDGLPADAWTGVLGPPIGGSTRTDLGPLEPGLAARVLGVGECLAAHGDAARCRGQPTREANR